jgi:uncharacterized membrane protein
MKITIPFVFYMLATGILALFILITPLLAFQNNPAAPVLYDNIFANICHQKLSRSLCLFQTNPGSYSIGDCTLQNGAFRNDSRAEKFASNYGFFGYKFPVSARDMLIYIGMFMGGLVLLLAGKADSKEIPSLIWFALAMVPMAIDGTTQLVGLRESINLLREATGLLAGLAVGIYMPLLLNAVFLGIKRRKQL